MRMDIRGVFCSVAVVAIAVPWAFSALKDSKHDFTKSSATWNTASREACRPCHTPHHARSALIPLWNHETTVSTFTLYDSETFQGKGTIVQPTGVSKVCLSCHDGTLALNAFGGNSGSGDRIPASADLGKDLSNDHPICFTYDSTLAALDGELHDPALTTVASLGGKTIKEGMLVNDALQCTSCHDAHAERGDASASSAMLLVNNEGSALCLTCHAK